MRTEKVPSVRFNNELETSIVVKLASAKLEMSDILYASDRLVQKSDEKYLPNVFRMHFFSDSSEMSDLLENIKKSTKEYPRVIFFNGVDYILVEDLYGQLMGTMQVKICAISWVDCKRKEELLSYSLQVTMRQQEEEIRKYQESSTEVEKRLNTLEDSVKALNEKIDMKFEYLEKFMMNSRK